jgi:copper transport protein
MTYVKRLLAFGALVVVLVGVFASPAFAHATLLTTEPQPGGKFTTSPRAVTLRFDEPVEVSLGGIRLFDGSGNRVDAGAPVHPGGAGNIVQSSIPDLRDGTYVVTWRVISADSHPIQGAFTFQVGTAASTTNADALARRLLSNQGGSTTVGVVYAIDRAAIFATIALLIGGIVFLAVVFPRGRHSRPARIAVWTGWFGLVAATIAGIALEGIYGSALPLSKIFDTSVFKDVLGTRYGHVSIARLVLLLLLVPFVRMMVPRRDDDRRSLHTWWYVLTGLLVVGLSFTPGLAGHAGTGEYTGLAIPADAIHVLAMSCWLGGLVLLFLVVLPRTDPDELRQGINRFSALGLGAIAALVVTGGFQAWRQVGSFDALRNTDYGKLLIAKLVAFSALVVAAAFSREIVNRRFRWSEEDFEDDVDDGAERSVRVPVTVGARSGEAIDGARPSNGERAAAPRVSPGAASEPIEQDDDATEVRRLRRSVVAELVIAVVILAITALLVNAAPARTSQTQPISMTLKSAKIWVDVVVAPGVAGGNDMHFTSLPVGDTVTNVEDMTVQLTKPGSNLPAFDVPLQKFGPGHYIAPQYDIPYPGQWQMTIRARLGATDEEVLVGKFNLR